MSETVRRQSRELALQVLFQREFCQEISHEKSLENFKVAFDAPSTVWKFAKTLLDGVISHLEKIDSEIKSQANNWSMDRMALVDLMILRIAVFEILFLEDTPNKVAVNEALEISKKYGGTDSHTFINGILGQLVNKSQEA